jgi:hypothetical protein
MLGLFAFVVVALPMTSQTRPGDADVVGRSMPLAFLFVGTYYDSC